MRICLCMRASRWLLASVEMMSIQTLTDGDCGRVEVVGKNARSRTKPPTSAGVKTVALVDEYSSVCQC